MPSKRLIDWTRRCEWLQRRSKQSVVLILGSCVVHPAYQHHHHAVLPSPSICDELARALVRHFTLCDDSDTINDDVVEALGILVRI
jgi:hypothetical protein